MKSQIQYLNPSFKRWSPLPLPVCEIWPAGNGCASITRWRCWIPKGLPEFLNVVELEIHHHIQSSLQEGSEGGNWGGGNRGGRKKGTKHTELNHGNQTHNKVSTARQAASLSLQALLVRQWASLNTAPCTLITRRILKATLKRHLQFFVDFKHLISSGLLSHTDLCMDLPTFSDLH